MNANEVELGINKLWAATNKLRVENELKSSIGWYLHCNFISFVFSEFTNSEGFKGGRFIDSKEMKDAEYPAILKLAMDQVATMCQEIRSNNSLSEDRINNTNALEGLVAQYKEVIFKRSDS